MTVDNPREYFDRVAVSIDPPSARIGYTPVKLWVYKGTAWVSQMILADELEDFVLGREGMFEYFERSLAEQLSHYYNATI